MVHQAILKARGFLEAGFQSEAAKKEVQTYVLGRAFEHDVHDVMTSKMLKARDEGDERLMKFYYECPYGLYQWRPHHAENLGKDFPAEVALANELAALREQVKAAPVVKLVSKAQERKVVEDSKRMTCQVCGRPILSEQGRVAHHGYQRPGYGYQTSSCFGARELPFEVERKVTDQWVEMLLGMCKRLEAKRKNVAEEKVKLRRSYDVGSKHGVAEFDRATFEQVKAEHPWAFEGHRWEGFDNFKEWELANLTSQIRSVRMDIRDQQKRLEGWKATHEWKNGWVKL